MRVKKTYIVCDVCEVAYFSDDSTTKIKFEYDDKSHKFDCCYKCLEGGAIRKMYKKVADFLKNNLEWTRKKGN